MNDLTDVRFLEGGKAVFTVSNDRGQHYTYKIRHPQNKPFFAMLLTGPDNESSYTYLGIYNPQQKKVYLTQKSRYKEDSTPVKVLRWAINVLAQHKALPAGYSIQHEGRCCCCGRKLTTPESINRGIGPECATRFDLPTFVTTTISQPEPIQTQVAETEQLTLELTGWRKENDLNQ